MRESPSITAGTLAQMLGGTLSGDGERVIRGVAILEDAGPDDLTWVASSEFLTRLEASKAGIVLMPATCPAPPSRTAIHVADPDLALSNALLAIAPPTETVPEGVDSSARVAPNATVTDAHIGPNVYIGPHAIVGPGTQLHAGAYIGADCEIGRDCVLWPNVVVRERTTIGDRVTLHPNTTIGADGFGYHQRDGRHLKIPQIGTVVIEDDVEVGANVCIDRARSGETRIGRGTKIDNIVQIGHNVIVGEDCMIVAQCGISGSVTLGRHVVLGGQVGVTDHVSIGDAAMLAAKSLVANTLPGGKIYRGIPAVEKTQFGRSAVSLRRLPKMIEQLRNLTKRVEELESATNNTTRG